MKDSPGKDNAGEIEQRAAEWVARLDVNDSAESRAAFDAWLNASPRHRAAYVRIAAAWERADNLRNIRPLDGEVDPDLLLFGDEAAPRRARWTWRWVVVMGVVVVVLALLAIAAMS